MVKESRRGLLRLGGVGLATGLAGCSLDPGQNTTTSPTTTPRQKLKNKITELQERIETLEAKLQRKTEQLTALRSELQAKQEKIAALKSDLASLERKLDERNQTISTLRAKLEKKKKRITKLERQAQEYEYSAEIRAKATATGKQLRHAVVALEFELDDNRFSGGTGWFIDENHIITNRHVVSSMVKGKTQNEVGYLLDGTSFEFSVQSRTDDPEDDIALLRTDEKAPYVPPLGSASTLSRGQPLIQVGHPSLIGNWVVSLGEYLKEPEYWDTFYTEMPSTNGNSGSPVAKLDGTVVGLTYSSLSREHTSGPPEPVEPTAVEEYPYQERQYQQHETVGTVKSYYRQWTR